MKAGKRIFAYQKNDFVIIFKVGKTSNAKIASGLLPIVQQYAFSIEQWKSVGNKSIDKNPLKSFFSKDENVCFDCPFNSKGAKRCYTHKFNSFNSFLYVINDAKKQYGEVLPELPENCPDELLQEISGKYIRFGVYGEPILLPLVWVESIANVSKNWTGYTHQWKRDEIQPYARFFMASTESKETAFLAMALGWRIFNVTKEQLNKDSGQINCPASKESGYKTTCANCGLCKGNSSKGKSIFIIEH